MNFSIFIQKNPDFSDFPSSAAAETLRTVFRERITAYGCRLHLTGTRTRTAANIHPNRDNDPGFDLTAVHFAGKLTESA